MSHDKAEGKEVGPNHPSISMRMTTRMIKTMFPSVQQISCAQLSEWIEDDDADIIIVDVRPEVEYIISHIYGSIRVDPESDTEPFIDDMNIKGKKIICYCSVGYRSSAFADRLQKHIQKSLPCGDVKEIKVFNLDGSLFQWANDHRPLVDNENRTTPYAHPYNAIWGKLLHSELRKSK